MDSTDPEAEMIPIAIVAHPLRLGMARDLADEVVAEAISVDTKGEGVGRNHLKAWRWLRDSPAEWVVVLEDDAVPVPGFRYQLDAALAQAPSDVVSLYLGRGRPPHRQDAIARAIMPFDDDPHWLTAAHLFHAVGYAVRHHLLGSMCHGISPRLRELPIDEAITDWAQQWGHLVSYTRPSLVDHRDLVSLVLHPDGQPRTEKRVAWLCAARDNWNSSWAPLKVGDEFDERLA